MINTSEKEIVLVITAHPDDETLGVGGTIARHILARDSVYAVSMTDWISSRETVLSEDIDARRAMAVESSNILGFCWIDSKDFPDNQMDTVPLLDVVKTIESIKLQITPTIIYTHGHADINIDHRILN